MLMLSYADDDGVWSVVLPLYAERAIKEISVSQEEPSMALYKRLCDFLVDFVMCRAKELHLVKEYRCYACRAVAYAFDDQPKPTCFKNHTMVYIPDAENPPDLLNFLKGEEYGNEGKTGR